MADLKLSAMVPSGVLDAGVPRHPDSPAKTRDAAQQFESLLLSQILHSARQGSGGWLGSGEDSSSDTATEFAEQHFAEVLARQGGLGLASMIAKSLDRGQPVT